MTDDPYRVLGHRRAKSLTGLDPSRPQASLEDLLCGRALGRMGGSAEALRRYGELLGAAIARICEWSYWRGVERVYLGGGISQGESGRVVLDSAAKSAPVELALLPHDPDHAGLLGAAQAAGAHEAFVLAADLGGTNFRVGAVRAPAELRFFGKTRHAGGNHTRESLITLLAERLSRVHEQARAAALPVAGEIVLGCPGQIGEDGSITEGARNLPGTWTAPEFHVAGALARAVRGFRVKVENDAVLQGLSVLPHLGRVREWGVLTLGTGLGNARFSR